MNQAFIKYELGLFYYIHQIVLIYLFIDNLSDYRPIVAPAISLRQLKIPFMFGGILVAKQGEVKQ